MTHRLIKSGELLLYGTVGATPMFFDDDSEDFRGFTDVEVIKALTEMGDGDIDVRVNSGGGVALQGVAIFNALKNHNGNVTVYVDGIAASAASIIAMAGDEVVMREGSMMMIHDASGLTMGTAKDHNKAIEALARLDSSMAGIYAKRMGGSNKDARALMAEETWFTAQEAVDEGLADRTDEKKAEEPVAFDYRMYAHAPDYLVSKAEQMFNVAPKRAKPKEKAMTKETQTPTLAEFKAANAEMVAALQAEMKAQAEAEAAEAAATAKAEADAAEAAAKLAAQKTTAEATKSTGETVEQIEARITARASDIFAACDLAGKPDKAAEYVASKLSVSQVISELQKNRSTTGTEPTARHTAKDPKDPENTPPVSWDGAVSKVNKTLAA